MLKRRKNFTVNLLLLYYFIVKCCIVKLTNLQEVIKVLKWEDKKKNVQMLNLSFPFIEFFVSWNFFSSSSFFSFFYFFFSQERNTNTKHLPSHFIYNKVANESESLQFKGLIQKSKILNTTHVELESWVWIITQVTFLSFT